MESTVRRAVAENHTVDNLALEVNSLKFAQNRTFADCVLAIVPAVSAPWGSNLTLAAGPFHHLFLWPLAMMACVL